MRSFTDRHRHLTPLWVLFSLFFGLAPLSMAGGPPPSKNAPGLEGRVVTVHDGDTVRLEGGEEVRYLGIDTPEMDHEHGHHAFMAKEALLFNRELVQGKRVRILFDEEKADRHDRLLAYVFTEGGLLVNLALLEKGFGWVLFDRKRLKYADAFIEAQRQAMKKGVGVWSRLPRKGEAHYLGNRSSNRFHRPSCPWGKKTSPGNVVRFKTVYEAFWEGFSPCRVCRPQDE